METPIVKLFDEKLSIVYEPSENSYLLVEALEADLENLHAMKPRICLEISIGSDIVIIFSNGIKKNIITFNAGLFYLVVIKENDPEYILGAFKKLNISSEIVHERKVRGQHLYVLRFRKGNEKLAYTSEI
ncbi:hypothetical protein ALC53_05038 [Atta colombica]|uniref:Uncharacterized protein n=1 Tax=Atta colombica TaxID=520822 RepID=A0A151I4G0_9HYME|nr:hypothetical protein ALC53_05038 [Atta colombica]